MTDTPSSSASDLEQQLVEAIRHGASMEEIAKLREPSATTPVAALQALRQGNARFFSGEVSQSDFGANLRRAQIMGQTPFAVVLGCSDSRVPVEFVFDQGPGNLFVVRVAGNIVDPATLGSIEYAIKHLKCHLVLVLGHEGCGAVQAAMLSSAQIQAEPPFVQHLIAQIRPAVQDLPAIRDTKARLREAVVAHVRHQVQELKQNDVVQQAIMNGQIAVVGGFYEIGSGAVDFLVSDEDLAL